jgi:hypothetical protein
LKSGNTQLEHAHEYIKLRMKLFGDTNAAKFEDIAVKALESDSEKQSKIAYAENMHKRLLKAKASG